MATDDANNRDYKERGEQESASGGQGLAVGLLEEVIKAEMSMHHAQAEAWKWFKQHRPKGEYINEDIYKGFAEKYYLCLDEVELTLPLKPVSNKFFTRLWLAWRLILGKAPPVRLGERNYIICHKQDKEAMRLRLLIKRNSKGEFELQEATSSSNG